MELKDKFVLIVKLSPRGCLSLGAFFYSRIISYLCIMIINTQYKIGEQVFFLQYNKITNSTIVNIQISVNQLGTFIRYYLSNIEIPLDEKYLFSSKEILRQSL